MSGEWSPTCSLPSGLVVPVRVDRSGREGPTRRQASGPRWRRTSPGRYVPAHVDSERIVEQHILEQASRLPGYGAITGWASLRWQGAAYFDGRDSVGDRLLPVPLTIGEHMIRGDDSVTIRRGQLGKHERQEVRGIWCTTWQRALFDEIVRRGSLRPGVVAADMTWAARLGSPAEFWRYLDQVRPRNGVVLGRAVATLTRPTSWSPQEVSMRLCWVLDAGLPEPLGNVPVFDLAGNLLGIPDLFDEQAGVVGEYQGAVHRDPGRHRRDVERAERFRDHGLEYFEVVGGQLHEVKTAGRMRRVRSRARFLPPEERSWTLAQPAWWVARQAAVAS
jgi:hypothetical protein